MRAITRVSPFGSLADADYHALGFRGGLEIHQQLLTASKLFCRCPAGLYSAEYDAEILRHMRPTLSEMGEYDGTALMEFKTRKDIIYRIRQETCCTYEMDDTPPFDMNAEAIDIGLTIALLLNCSIVSEIHIIRKQYLDGSIPTGFQRTAIVGVEGHIPFRGRRVGIKQLAVEEDSCRQVADQGHRRTYLTDRLGIPLIETVTQPDMTTPGEMAAVGQILRRLTRATGLVRAGIGAARQDVNVSVTGGTRAEIKGVPKLPMIPRLVHNEAMRQRALLDIRAELKRRGVTKTSFRALATEVSALLAGEGKAPTARTLSAGGKVYAVTLAGFAGVLTAQTQETKRFLDDFADRVRVVACLDVLPNILAHEAARGELAEGTWRRIRHAAKATPKDALVLVWGPPADARLGADEIILRAREATLGVPSETRQALADGTTGFERVLPGPDRMYPDTDRPPITLSEDRIAQLADQAGEPVWTREERYRGWGVPEDCVAPLAASRWAPTYDRLVKKYEADPKLAATTIMHRIKGWGRRGWPVEKIGPADLERTFSLYQQGKITREGIAAALGAYLNGDRSLRQILNDLSHSREAEAKLPATAAQVKKRVARRKFPNGPAAARRYAMGEIMAQFRGLVPAEKVLKLVEENVVPTPRGGAGE